MYELPSCDNSAARRIFHEKKTSRTHEINLFNFFFAHSNNEPLYMKTLLAQAFNYVDSQEVGT